MPKKRVPGKTANTKDKKTESVKFTKANCGRRKSRRVASGKNRQLVKTRESPNFPSNNRTDSLLDKKLKFISERKWSWQDA